MPAAPPTRGRARASAAPSRSRSAAAPAAPPRSRSRSLPTPRRGTCRAPQPTTAPCSTATQAAERAETRAAVVVRCLAHVYCASRRCSKSGWAGPQTAASSSRSGRRQPACHRSAATPTSMRIPFRLAARSRSSGSSSSREQAGRRSARTSRLYRIDVARSGQHRTTIRPGLPARASASTSPDRRPDPRHHRRAPERPPHPDTGATAAVDGQLSTRPASWGVIDAADRRVRLYDSVAGATTNRALRPGRRSRPLALQNPLQQRHAGHLVGCSLGGTASRRSIGRDDAAPARARPGGGRSQLYSVELGRVDRARIDGREPARARSALAVPLGERSLDRHR